MVGAELKSCTRAVSALSHRGLSSPDIFYKAAHSSLPLPREVSLEGSEAEHHVQGLSLSVPEKPVLREGGSVCVYHHLLVKSGTVSAWNRWLCLEAVFHSIVLVQAFIRSSLPVSNPGLLTRKKFLRQGLNVQPLSVA